MGSDSRKLREPIAMINILRPVIRMNQFIGICPHEIEDETLIFRWSSMNFVRTIFTLVILSLYFLHILFQFGTSFAAGKKLDVVELVNLACWLNGTLIPIAMLCLTIYKRDQFKKFFQKMSQYKAPLKGMIDCQRTQKCSRRLYVLYAVLTIFSIIFVVTDAIRKPTADYSLLVYFDDPPIVLIGLNTLWQSYLVLVKSGASAFIEVLCCSLAGSFVSSLKKIQQEMRETIERRESDLDLHTRMKNNGFFSSSSSSLSSIGEAGTGTGGFGGGLHSKLSLHNESLMGSAMIPGYEFDTVELYPKLTSPFRGVSRPFESSSSSNGKYGMMLECEGALPLLRAVKRFHCIASMQRLINCIFGPILALNIALLVFMCCVLLFLEIKYLGLANVDTYEGLIFSGRSISFFIRLIIIFLSLGNLHEASMAFNGALAQSLIQVKKPKPSEINLILAHLTTNIANPICFSAGGFFIFSRGSLLAVFSIITTYLVFLLQAGAGSGSEDSISGPNTNVNSSSL